MKKILSVLLCSLFLTQAYAAKDPHKNPDGKTGKLADFERFRQEQHAAPREETKENTESRPSGKIDYKEKLRAFKEQRANQQATKTANLQQIPSLQTDPPIQQDPIPEIVLGGLANRAGTALVKGACFPGKTPICIEGKESSAQVKRIKKIRVGDWVKSFNFSTSTVECREVKDIFPSTVHELTVLSFGGKVLRATDNHPFYVPAADLWVPARSLHVGDELQTMSGSTVRIDDIQVKRGSFRVYNFEVEGNNNYYSGNVLVHNCNGLRSLGQGFRAIDSAAKNVPARWGHWSDLKKVQVGNKEYAEVGNLLYKQHAIERMAPNGLIQQGNKIYSRGVPPMVVEHAVKNGRKSPGQYANTVEHVFENVTVITDGSHKIVHTVIRKGH